MADLSFHGRPPVEPQSFISSVGMMRRDGFPARHPAGQERGSRGVAHSLGDQGELDHELAIRLRGQARLPGWFRWDRGPL